MFQNQNRTNQTEDAGGDVSHHVTEKTMNNLPPVSHCVLFIMKYDDTYLKLPPNRGLNYICGFFFLYGPQFPFSSHIVCAESMLMG